MLESCFPIISGIVRPSIRTKLWQPNAKFKNIHIWSHSSSTKYIFPTPESTHPLEQGFSIYFWKFSTENTFSFVLGNWVPSDPFLAFPILKLKFSSFPLFFFSAFYRIAIFSLLINQLIAGSGNWVKDKNLDLFVCNLPS